MKNKFLVLTVLLGLIVQAQLTPNFGAKAGINYAVLDLGDRTKEKNLGFFGGITANFDITEKFIVQPEILYSKYKIAYSWEDGSPENYYRIDREFNSSSFLIPIALGYKIKENIKVYAGPQFDINMNTDFDFKQLTIQNGITNENTFGSEVEDLDAISLNGFIGSEYTFSNNLGIDLRYIYGFSKIVDIDDAPHKSYFQLGVHYTFLPNTK